MAIKAPWIKNYGNIPYELDYPDYSMCEAVYRMADTYPESIALTYMGRKITYAKLRTAIEETAKAFYALGVREGDRVTICLPNVPQTVYCLYALNRIGALASMVHPLSAVGEIVFYLKETESQYAVTLDLFYGKFDEVLKQYGVKKLIVTSAGDELDRIKKVGFKLTSGRKIAKVPEREDIIRWKDFLAGAKSISGGYIADKKGKDAAVILFSGGTTGVTKGILLSNLNFNALGMQTEAMSSFKVHGLSMLAAMPMFHGFGLGVCVHTILMGGGTSILVPRFSVKEYAKLIKKNKPNFIAGVPTLYEAITRSEGLEGVKLDFLRGVFSGGDSLSIELKKKFDKFLDDHGSPVHIREGYGTTECVTASCLTPYHMYREGSIGFPYPDTYFTICIPGTTEDVDYGTEGEICLSGPSVMLGYLNKPEENANTLRIHDDGRVWLHTGDLGLMDKEGFIYFKQRIKRMIITSGYNVYPSQIENIVDAHEAVLMSCAIGVKDPYKMQKVKVFVVLKSGFKPSDELKADILNYCKKHIAKYALPYDIEFRTELPKTLVGKIAYTVLEKEEDAKTSVA